METTSNPVYQQSVIDFVSVANDFCLCLEEAEFRGIREFIDKLNGILPALYLSARKLPEFDDRYDELAQRFIDEQDYEFLRNKLSRKLGQYDAFEEVFEENRMEYEDAVGASISEYLADIFQDVKDFILLYQLGSEEVMYEAVWECRQNFINFWGQKLVNVLRAIHNLNYSPEELEENQEIKQENRNFNSPDTSNWIISQRQRDNQKDA